MKTIGIVLVGVILMAVGAGSAFASGGADIYTSKCAVCHGPNGEGAQTGPALKGNDFILKATVEEVKMVILTGRGGSDKLHPEVPLDMPGGLVSEAEAGLLVEYMKGDLQK